MADGEFKPLPIKKVTVVDEVANQVKQMIINGHLKPGNRLPSEHELAEMFSVGRTSIREALKALDALGLLERTQQGTFVKESMDFPLREFYLKLIVHKHTIDQLYEARMLLEGMIAQLAAERATEEDIGCMQKCLDEMYTDDLEQYIRADIGFHVAIAEAANNYVIFAIYQIIWDLLADSQNEIVRLKDLIQQSREQHKIILAAIKKHDSFESRRLMDEHLHYLNTRRRQMIENPDSSSKKNGS